MRENYSNVKTIVLGRDSRPTGEALEKIAFFSLKTKNQDFKILPLGIAPIPEVMNWAKEKKAAFFYISASHNPIGYNGFKFGIGEEGVFESEKAKVLIEMFKKNLENPNSDIAYSIIEKANATQGSDIESKDEKKKAFNSYFENEKCNIANVYSANQANIFFEQCKSAIEEQKDRPLYILCDFNGSARATSIDKKMFENVGITFLPFNNVAGEIVHGIIPEGDNLTHLAKEVETCWKIHNGKGIFLGYMPDCDGDRGNVVYLDGKGKAYILKSQEVFCLAVIAEVLHSKSLKKDKIVAVANGPTSLLLEEIAKLLEFNVFRAEVGEANVVNLSKKCEKEGYYVRIFGEGSNGGCIIPPSLVRDPLNTLFAILKFFMLKGEENIFLAWQKACGKQEKSASISSFEQLIASLPKYNTTPVAEKRAILKIKIENVKEFRRSFQKVFTEEWGCRKEDLRAKYGFEHYRAYAYMGSEEIEITKDFAKAEKGGFKIIFYNEKCEAQGFIWMRASGTEPVFRIMADIKNASEKDEIYLLEWEESMIKSSLKNAHL